MKMLRMKTKRKRKRGSFFFVFFAAKLTGKEKSRKYK